MRKPRTENTARLAAHAIRHHLEWARVDKAREEAAQAVRQEIMIPELRDAIAEALEAEPRQRGRIKHPHPPHWWEIGWKYRELTRKGKSRQEALDAIAAMPKFGNISAETVRQRVKYFNKQLPKVWERLERADIEEGS